MKLRQTISANESSSLVFADDVGELWVVQDIFSALLTLFSQML